ncbi:hypothetical protein Q2T94_01490 [Paeniglutamicibacter sulfureus]|uniref:hypothetical protein n=1 Tax=Paeniglutamicibacter sulfureus TaxID=43666 RepID=UPI0026662A8E|nr:hypothetical protein [Paeniglutamicibacter sulfureus]MDO2932979.1 hypothetical protein [Paeniglutamicibacter sulfureus]
MDELTQELAVHVAERRALISGDPELLQTLFQEIGVDSSHTSRVGQGTTDLAAMTAGLTALSTSIDSAWVQLTPDSHMRLLELLKHNVPIDGLFSGVIRGEKGRIDSFMQFTTGGINPAAMANIATLAATIALRSAIAQLETLVQSMDVKLDQLLQDNRAKALGDINGLTQVLARAVDLFDEAGLVTDTAWSQIAGHATALAQVSSHALAQIDAMTKSIPTGTFARQADALKSLTDSELRPWLIILAAAQANQLRLETLELAHLGSRTPEAVPAHAAAIKLTSERRQRTAIHHLQALLDVIGTMADVSDLNRIKNPLKSRIVLDSAERAIQLIAVFGEIYDLQDLVFQDVERESWRKSLSDLGKSTTTVVASAAKSVPVGIAKASGDAVIKAASQIEAKREPDTRTESDSDPNTGSQLV